MIGRKSIMQDGANPPVGKYDPIQLIYEPAMAPGVSLLKCVKTPRKLTSWSVRHRPRPKVDVRVHCKAETSLPMSILSII